MSEYILTTNNLTKSFRKHKAVNNVSMHLKRGSIYGFIGRNGAGKTTFMKMIGGLSSPTSGDMTLFGCTGSEIGKVRCRIGSLIENPGIYPDVSAAENLRIRCIAAGVYSPEYVQKLLKLVCLDNTGKKKAKSFSLGMKQRLGIALALVGDPDLLLLDEPTNGLDPQGIMEVRETLVRLVQEKNITILISSHILSELSKLATDYGIIHNGELIKEISAEELQKLCSDRVEINADNTQLASTILDNIGITNYTVTDSSHITISDAVERSAEINTALVKGGVSVSEIKIEGQDLEEYYVSLTGGTANV